MSQTSIIEKEVTQTSERQMIIELISIFFIRCKACYSWSLLSHILRNKSITYRLIEIKKQKQSKFLYQKMKENISSIQKWKILWLCFINKAAYTALVAPKKKRNVNQFPSKIWNNLAFSIKHRKEWYQSRVENNRQTQMLTSIPPPISFKTRRAEWAPPPLELWRRRRRRPNFRRHSSPLS